MSEPNSHICPECSTPRASDGTPSCACGRRASEALLEARTAEAAAAEDFDPLRIRPYVELGDAPGSARDGEPGRGGYGASSTSSTQTLFPTPPSPSPYASPSSERSPLSGPSLPATSPASPSSGHSGRRRRRRTGLVVALAGAAAAGVMAAAGLASGLFSYDAPERDRALPDDLRASAPDTSPDGEASPVEPSGEGKGGAPGPAPTGGGAASPRPTKSPSPSPSPSQTSGSPSASASADPTESAPSASASSGSSGSSAAGADEADDSRLVTPKALRLGDDDPEVTELQLRLRQLGIYNGDIDENFDSQVEQAVLFYQSTRGITKDQDEPGVYGLVTRERLESETKEP
ncbi:peptidoglycan-binding protein [Streptomyces sp. NPDC057474]|uniref:peptidoglycan-binding domain-containing protein n=1 Tax=Streptomyces sp. NPDC057474 TaxID=3346144 RepID=UPI0036A1918C